MEQQTVVELLIALVAFITTVITIIGPVVRTLLSHWANKKWQELQAELPENIVKALQQAARVAVLVVEATNLEAASKDKLAEAINIAENWLALQGYKVDLDTIREAIESVLFELKQEGKL